MKFLLIILAGLSLSSCAIFKDPYTGNVDVQKIVRYIEPASYFSCKLILSQVEDEGDKRDKAIIIFNISSALRQLAGGVVPSAREIEAVINSSTPNKLHWAELAADLGFIYERFYENVSEDDRVGLALNVLGELAEGCERAAKPYVTINEWEDHVDDVVVPFNSKEILHASGLRRFSMRARP